MSQRPGLANRLDALLRNSSLSSKEQSLDTQSSPPSPLDSPSDMRASLPSSATPRSSTPILRWLSSLLDGPMNHSPPLTPSTSADSLALLTEALTEPMPITRPALARLPESFRASHKLTRGPAFVDNLTRSTLPTSSLSPPLSVSLSGDEISVPNITRPPPIVLTHSQPSRSSLDSLRSVSIRSRSHTRSMTTISSTSIASSLQPDIQPSASASSRWWFQSEQKDNTDALLSEDDRVQHLNQKYKSPKNPVVFCHGLLGFDSVMIGPAIAPFEVTHWRGIKEVLEENGTEVLITRVPATSSPIDRAKVLEKKISEVYPGRAVHLIGHSMGGLDCRYLTTHLTSRKFRVLSITTIATPHRGSSFADHFLATVGPARMPSVLSLLDLLPNGGGDGTAFECLTIESMRKFNEETPDVPGVRYFSWGAVYSPGLIDTWKWPHSVILEKEGPNDGLVSVESSKWGTYLGTVSEVNHLDLVGWINTARYKWAEMRGKEIKFRPATFYLGIVDMLAKEVEGDVDGEGESVGEGSDTVADGSGEAQRKETKVGSGVDLEEDKEMVDVRSPTESVTPTTEDPHGKRTPSTMHS